MRQPPAIAQLPEAVANQIAAGEVVERPAAVVKELAENSIDAGATRIAVASEDGGRRLIEVADDGHGMRPDDLRLALSRHATSKLRDADDLFRIATLGFRGEALPSIAAVAEFALASRPHDAPAGHEIVLAGGRELRSGPCAMPPGTRVSVRNLFWNVPARLKFLKSEAAETGHIAEQVMRLALAHPRIAFAVTSDGRTVLDLPPVDDLAARIAALFESELATALLPVSADSGACQLGGFIGHPRTARPSGKRQYLFLNGRFVRDRILLAAVKEGGKGYLEPRLHLPVFLHLDIDPSQVDVNVHPTKSEVRFRNEGEIFALVVRGMREALASQPGGFSLLGGAPVVQREVVKAPRQADPPQIVVQELFLPIAEPARAEPPAAARARDDAAAAADPQPAAATAGPRPPAGEAPLRYEPPPRTAHGGRVAEAAAATPTPAAAPVPAAAPAPAPPPAPLAGVRRVLQLNRMFLLIETDRGIRLVDQHAVHEKALWLMLDPATSDLLAGGRQELLVPIAVRLPPPEMALVAGMLDRLAASGIHARVVGDAIHITAIPARLPRLDWTGFLLDLAAEGGAAVDRIQERIAHRLACRAAVKAGQELSHAEMLELVRLLLTMDGLEHCPHGRPTTLDLSWDELSRRFQR